MVGSLARLETPVEWANGSSLTVTVGATVSGDASDYSHSEKTSSLPARTAYMTTP